MKRIALFVFSLLAVLAGNATGVSEAAELQFAGVVGNSGGEGMWLVHSAVGPGGIVAGGGGVALDARGRIFTGGGDRILTLNHDGKQLWQTPLPDKNWVVGGATFAVAGKYLYFIAGKPRTIQGGYSLLSNPFMMTEPNLCRVEMVPGATAEVAVKYDWFRSQGWPDSEIALTASADRTSVYLGSTTSRSGAGKYSVFEVLIAGSPPKLLFILNPLFNQNIRGGRVSVDEFGDFYLGGNHQVQKVNARGEPLKSFTPVALPSLGAVASTYEGTVILTRDAMWDMGHYGFLGRYTREMKPAPGVVVQWQHALGWTAQIVDAPGAPGAPGGDYYLQSTGGLYLGRLIDDRLTLLKRFGSLPDARCLVLTDNGYIGVDGPSFSGFFWFDFDNPAANAAPVRTVFPTPRTQGFVQGDSALAYGVAPNHLPREYQPYPKGLQLLTFDPEPFTGGANVTGGPTGQFDGRITAITRVGQFIFAIDAEHHHLARAPADKPCDLVTIDTPPTPWNSLTRLGQDQLLLSGGGAVQAFRVDAGGNLKPVWQIKGFGHDPDSAFGDEIYVAASGSQLLVADTRRHRILLFQSDPNLDRPPVFQSQFGETDHSGTDNADADSPRLVSINGGKAVFYDSGNQRLVKLRIH